MENLLTWVSWDHRGDRENNVGCTEHCSPGSIEFTFP